MKRQLLTNSELEQSLKNLNQWQLNDKRIQRKIVFESFSEAFAFMTQVALAAEKMDHHPDWSNSFNKVTISLTTHSSGGITLLDINLATYIDTLL